MNKPDRSAVESLIISQIPEGKTVEYKRDIPGKADSQMTPFLAAVASFANSRGGNIYFGVEAFRGLPEKLSGVEMDDLDAELLRLDHALQNGLEPRVQNVTIQPIQIDDGRHVLVVHVPKSWNAPHRVKKNSKFYARNSAGRYELDVDELREAFTMMDRFAKRIRKFNDRRIKKIQAEETPVPMTPGGRMVVHVSPLPSHGTTDRIDIAKYEHDPLPPIDPHGWSRRINLDGVVTFGRADDGLCNAYTQMFRQGVVESVYTLPDRKEKIIPSLAYEQYVIELLGKYFEFTVEFEIEPPFFVFLSFVNVYGYRFAIRDDAGFGNRNLTFSDNGLLLPEVIVEDLEIQPEQVLKPAFDMVWNNFGFVGSRNYDEEGNCMSV